MLRSAVGKVMWVGRATVFLVGLAVIVGVTVGLGSAAVAQNQNQPPGQQGVFRLATTNTAEAVSKLVGSVAQDALLLVDNNGGGPALDLQVEPGQAPMKVNSPGKVDNLNADQLDGKSGTDFYAQGSKVADSAHADRADSATSAANADRLDNLESSAFQKSNAAAGGDLTGNYPNPDVRSNAVGSSEIADRQLTSADVAIADGRREIGRGTLSPDSCLFFGEVFQSDISNDVVHVTPSADVHSSLTFQPRKSAAGPNVFEVAVCNRGPVSVDHPSFFVDYVVINRP